MPQPEARPETFAEVHPVTAALAPVLALPILEMARFRRLMNYEGWEVDLARMCVDTAYAYQCLATAHTSSDTTMRIRLKRHWSARERSVRAL